METYQFLVVLGIGFVYLGVTTAVHRQVVAHSAANERLLHLWQRIHAVVDVEQRTMVVVEVGARLGVKARGTGAALASLQVVTVHGVHVGAGTTQVADVAFEILHLGHLLHLTHYRLLAA